MRLDAATFLLQWASGGLAFLWFTLRRNEISLGYSKLLRAVYGSLALLGVAAGFYFDGNHALPDDFCDAMFDAIFDNGLNHKGWQAHFEQVFVDV